ncbi:M56 family metallopeptidase [Dysgonomonas sp. ZJ279]|uniref:M56 family metallopeptidase n=1 Tax=Dysgonomonas sp. ZJ279 TaxID=2709796 RepID=UPI0013EABE06|nr:M56 family metallopeptidase [Dysgonomonas sp. ZJ279]
MKEFIVYLLQSSICLSIFLIIYQIFFRSSTFFKFNRSFLMLGMITSLAIPLIPNTYNVYVTLPASNEIADNSVGQLAANDSIDIWTIVFALYITGMLIIIIRNIRTLGNFIQLLRSGTLSKNKTYKLIDTVKVNSPLSVWNYIVINTQKLSDTEKDLIIKHEQTHINQKHWIDLLCSECMLLLHWFNPLIWFYIFLLKENHEFLADKAVIDSGTSPALYKAVLINQRFQGPVFSFSNSFNYLNNLNRLVMIKKTKSSPRKRFAALAIIPALGLFFWASAQPRYIVDEYAVLNKETIADSNDSGVTQTTTKDASTNKSTSTLPKPKMINVLNMLIILDGETITIDEYSKVARAGKLGERTAMLSGEEAVAIYGEEGKNGVVIFETEEYKKNKQSQDSKKGVKISNDKDNKFKDALIIIDGKEASQVELDAINTDNIESISVLKAESAIQPYGEKGKNGVIIIIMKK